MPEDNNIIHAHISDMRSIQPYSKSSSRDLKPNIEQRSRTLQPLRPLITYSAFTNIRPVPTKFMRISLDPLSCNRRYATQQMRNRTPSPLIKRFYCPEPIDLSKIKSSTLTRAQTRNRPIVHPLSTPRITPSEHNVNNTDLTIANPPETLTTLSLPQPAKRKRANTISTDTTVQYLTPVIALTSSSENFLSCSQIPMITPPSLCPTEAPLSHRTMNLSDSAGVTPRLTPR